ncbi:uncharacterized protein LOC141651170 [Silene latifolia]|uniref:uncharacterized protein LOC141651170 n=1 Tax=Silene latifolia TaxID=37657 RepID=UPI003D787250
MALKWALDEEYLHVRLVTDCLILVMQVAGAKKISLLYKTLCDHYHTLTYVISDPLFHRNHLHGFCKETRNLPTINNILNRKTLKIIGKIDMGDFRFGASSIVGYVDGVLLIHVSLRWVNNGANTIFLWNLTIKKILEIPPYESLKKRDVNFGFGFDSLSGVYKVVDVNLKYYESKTKVYNLSSRSWTSPKQTSCSIDNVVYLSKYSRSINFKGGIYWLAKVEEKGKSMTHYLRFNLSSETFNCLKLPDFKPESGLHERWRRLSVLYDSIALIDCSGMGYFGHVHVWVMRKDITNKVDSWVELCKLDLRRKSFVFLKNNGDVYLRKARTIGVYDLDTLLC